MQGELIGLANISTEEQFKNSDIERFEMLANHIAYIIKRKKMENALKTKDDELFLKNIIFETSIAANSIANVDGLITHVNSTFLKLWGYDKKSEATGKPISHFFMNENDAISVLRTLNDTGKWKGKFMAKRKDGSTFISQGLATIIHNENGEFVGYQSTNMNITERELVGEKWRKARKDSD